MEIQNMHRQTEQKIDKPTPRKVLNLTYAILQIRKTVDSANSKSLHRAE
jgi:hypothetical protein